jgi:hypothetical protein
MVIARAFRRPLIGSIPVAGLSLGCGIIFACSPDNSGGDGHDPPYARIISSGNDGTVGTGGYIWTYTDHNPIDSEYHASVDQVTSNTIALQPVWEDAVHGRVLRITGSVPAALPSRSVIAQEPYTIDPYWHLIYADSMIPSNPSAGLTLSFLPHQSPFDATRMGSWIGIAFEMKVGTEVPGVYVSMPMVGTDLPDPHRYDSFPRCQYYTATNPPSVGYQACFAHYRKGFYDSATANNNDDSLAPLGTWKRYCVLYSEVGIPSSVDAITRANVAAFDPTQLIKLQWDMYQPSEGAEAVPFDISLDNIQFVTRDEALDPSNNCDPSMLDKPAGTGNEG